MEIPHLEWAQRCVSFAECRGPTALCTPVIVVFYPDFPEGREGVACFFVFGIYTSLKDVYFRFRVEVVAVFFAQPLRSWGAKHDGSFTVCGALISRRRAFSTEARVVDSCGLVSRVRLAHG